MEHLSPEAINDLRRKVLAGEEVDRGVLKAALMAGIGDRLDNWRKQQAPKSKRPRSSAKKVDLLSLLDAPPKTT